MVSLSKRLIPDDLRLYIADYANILPADTKPKQATCTTSSDPLDRKSGKQEPDAVAGSVTTLAESVTKAATVMQQVFALALAGRRMNGFDVQLLRGQVLK